MADDIDRSQWGYSQMKKETLEDYWQKLLEKADYCEKEEIKFFLHCTTLTGKKSIMKSGRLFGGKTNLPARAPLASYDELKGIWLAISTKELPQRSPYGTQRMIYRVRDIMTFLGNDLKENDESDNDDKWDAPESDDDKGKTGKSKKPAPKKKNKGKHKGKVNREQKECYLKHKLPPKPQLTVPLLFFECAHYYGSTQYVRLLLVRSSDPKAEWCRETCMELNIRDNPFLQFLHGRIWTYRGDGMGRYIVVEVLVVGDIVFDQLLEPPEWDEVGTVSRAGFDPRLGNGAERHNIRDNPFLQFLHGRIWTYRGDGMGRDIVVEVLVVGDIVFDQLLEPPEWDEVGTVSRAGFDPRLVYVKSRGPL